MRTLGKLKYGKLPEGHTAFMTYQLKPQMRTLENGAAQGRRRELATLDGNAVVETLGRAGLS